MEFQKLANLVGIPRRQDNPIPLVLKFLDDREEKRNVRGVVQIDPDSLPDSGRAGLGRVSMLESFTPGSSM